MLKASAVSELELQNHAPLANDAFSFNLRRYSRIITEKPVKFINSECDKLYQVKLDTGVKITDFDEFAALVHASSGYCRSVVVVTIGKGLHAVAAKGVNYGTFSSVACVNSWAGDGGATFKCTR